MSDGVRLQCASVERWPKRTLHDPVLPTVSTGSGRAACVICGRQVWVSRAAMGLARSDIGIKPVCERCVPARESTASVPCCCEVCVRLQKRADG